MLISRPFIKCPYCGKDAFGITYISSDRYFRRCKNCYKPNGHEELQSYPLPTLNKKVIFLDQFVISNILRFLHPKLRMEKANNLWGEIYQLLESATKGQMIICPYHNIHLDESLQWEYYEDAKRLLEHLSNNTSFHNIRSIGLSQLVCHAENWIQGNECPIYDFNPNRIVNGQINEWLKKIYFVFPKHYLLDSKEQKRGMISIRHKSLADVFERWQREENKSFRDWFEEEALSYGKHVLKVYRAHSVKLRRLGDARWNLDQDELLGPLTNDDYLLVELSFENTELVGNKLRKKVEKYFLDPSLINIPVNKITAMLWATIARKAASGQKRPPNRGMANDIDVIAALLPYCDAMFIDKECYAYLNESPLNQEVAKYDTRIFSLANSEEFLGYLNDIINSISDEQLSALRAVYGDEWDKPNLSLFDKGKN